MELSQFKKSVQELARTVGALVEEKLGERSNLEEQMRNIGRQVERMVTDFVPRAGASTGIVAEKVDLKFKRMPHFRGDLPAYATAGASGLDVRARIDEPVTLAPGERKLIPTGLGVEFARGYELQVRPRSGLAISKGLGLVNSPGTIDADYRGEIKVIVINLGSEAVVIQDQERIAQLVLCPVVLAEVSEVVELSETDRGAGGFGSTGV